MSWKAGVLLVVGLALASCGGTAAPASSSQAAAASPAASNPSAATAPASAAASTAAPASKPAAASAGTSAPAKPAASGKPAASAEAAPVASTSPGSADHGKQVYAASGCWECHGYAGQGSTATGPKLTPNPLPFVAFQAQVRTPRQDMPKYSTQALSDQDLADVYAFVQSIPAPPAASSIPLLTNR